MIDNAEDLKEKALANKPELKRKTIDIQIGNEKYDFRIGGIGAKTVKIEKYIKYDDIIEAIENGNDNGLEAIIKEMIEDYEPPEDE